MTDGQTDRLEDNSVSVGPSVGQGFILVLYIYGFIMEIN